MLSNYYTLQALAREAAPVLTGALIQEIFSQQRDELIISTGGDQPGLVLSCLPETSVFFLHQRLARARKNSADLFTPAWQHRIVSCTLLSNDRVLWLGLEDGRTIAGLFFGTAANVLLLTPDGTIEQAFRHERTLRGTPFQTRREEELYDIELIQRLSEEDPSTPLGTALRKRYPRLGSTLAGEVLLRAGLEAASRAGTLDDAAAGRMRAALHAVLMEVQRPAPRVYLNESGEAVRFSIIPLHQPAGFSERLFSSTHEAVRFFVARERAADTLAERKRGVLSHLRQQVEKTRRSLEAVRTDLGSAARAEEYERNGAALMAHLSEIFKGDREIELLLEKGPVRIALDRTLGPVQNAQRYFEKAKRARTAAVQSTMRIRDLEQHLAGSHSLLSALEAIDSLEEWKEAMKRHTQELAAAGIGKEGTPEQSPFRRFIVDGGFEVWAGKSSQNNDELTLRHAKPHDLWFHARGSSGSHVILRTATGKGEPGKKAREQAAAIAAYYSKMKNAGLVPVAMTERRYVRKPKGSKPGSVVIEREKVIFVKPDLPVSPQPE